MNLSDVKLNYLHINILPFIILPIDKQVVNQIKALSGSVIRIKKDEEVNITDEKAYFIIGGK